MAADRYKTAKATKAYVRALTASIRAHIAKVEELERATKAGACAHCGSAPVRDTPEFHRLDRIAMKSYRKRDKAEKDLRIAIECEVIDEMLAAPSSVESQSDE